MPSYVVAGCRSWNRRVFDESIVSLPGAWTYVDSPLVLTADALAGLAPRYVFFLHWSWRVPDEITAQFECVNFHLTNVPYGRGGSPLQNLILRGERRTKVSAIRMTAEMDAGPVYLKEDLELSGTAEEILDRSSVVAAGMIARIVAGEPEPVDQVGPVTLFERRRPEQSHLPDLDNLDQVHDFIRMLDGEGYPPAFIEVGDLRIELRRSSRYADRVVADAVITRRLEGDK